ncbi:MAG: hypothetical protein M3179_13315, partial [Actinomycetota bacterium]|nr:hypothetical protein [Actinomycetota bacterium]
TLIGELPVGRHPFVAEKPPPGSYGAMALARAAENRAAAVYHRGQIIGSHGRVVQPPVVPPRPQEIVARRSILLAQIYGKALHAGDTAFADKVLSMMGRQ